MNAKHLVTSLSQQLDTSCTDFPDGFEETQQQQVSTIVFSFLRVDDENLLVLERFEPSPVNKCKSMGPL